MARTQSPSLRATAGLFYHERQQSDDPSAFVGICHLPLMPGALSAPPARTDLPVRRGVATQSSRVFVVDGHDIVGAESAGFFFDRSWCGHTLVSRVWGVVGRLKGNVFDFDFLVRGHGRKRSGGGRRGGSRDRHLRREGLGSGFNADAGSETSPGWGAIKDNHVLSDDLGAIALYPVLTLPVAGVQAAFDIDLAAASQILRADLGQLAPGDYIVKLHLFLLLAAGLIVPAAVDRKSTRLNSSH